MNMRQTKKYLKKKPLMLTLQGKATLSGGYRRKQENKILSRILSVIAMGTGLAIFGSLVASPAQAGRENCECYMDGYAAGARKRTSGLSRVPKRCMKQGVTQFPGLSNWSYSIGQGKGMQVEGPTNRSTRQRNRKWAQDRAAEHKRNKRLVCY